MGAADAVETFKPLRAIYYLPLSLTFTTQATVAALQPLLRISRGFVAVTGQINHIGHIVWVLLGILLHMRTKRSVLKADRTQIGRNHLASRDCLRGSPLYIGIIIVGGKPQRGNPEVRVESSTGVNKCNPLKLIRGAQHSQP